MIRGLPFLYGNWSNMILQSKVSSWKFCIRNVTVRVRLCSQSFLICNPSGKLSNVTYAMAGKEAL